MSRVELLTPLAAVVGILAAIPLAVLWRSHRRSNIARRAVGLAARPVGAAVLPAAALAVLAALLVLAAAQPVLRTERRVAVRGGVGAYVVIDTSRSMLAAAGPRAPTRLERARRAAVAVRAQLAGVPVGIASVSDRVLPHLFPTADPEEFARTLVGAVRAGQPPPEGGGVTTSSVAALGALAQDNFFAPTVRRRAAIVLTDAESIPFDARELQRALRSGPGVTVEVVRMGSRAERVFDPRGVPEPGFRPDPRAPAIARQVAALAGGRAFDERDAVEAGRAVARLLGQGAPRAELRPTVTRTPLAPYVLLAAVVPLGILLGSRNLGTITWRRRPAGRRANAWTPATLFRARRRSSVG